MTKQEREKVNTEEEETPSNEHTQDRDVFSQADPSGNSQEPSPTYETPGADPNDPLNQLVGEGRKFKSPSDLAKAKMESDNFIEQLKRENAEMREFVNELHEKQQRSSKVEDRLRDIESSREREASQDRNQPGLSEEEIERRIQENLEKHEVQKTRQQRLETVERKIVNEFGDRDTAAKELARIADENEMSVADLREIAVKSPKAFDNIIGLGSNTNKERSSQNQGTPAKSTVNTASMEKAGTGQRTMSYYKNMMRENPSKYFSPEVQQQKMRDAQELGDAFFDE